MLSVLQFVFSGIKENRFLSPIVLGQATNISAASKYALAGKFFPLVAILLFVYALALPFSLGAYVQVLPNGSSLGGYRVYSDHWVYFYRAGIVTEPLPGEDAFMQKILGGSRLVLYDANIPSGLERFVLEKNENFAILGQMGLCEQRPDKYELKVWRG